MRSGTSSRSLSLRIDSRRRRSIEKAPVIPPVTPGVTGKDTEQITPHVAGGCSNKSGYTNRIVAVSTEQKIRRWIRRLRIGRRDAPLVLGILRQILWKFGKPR